MLDLELLNDSIRRIKPYILNTPIKKSVNLSDDNTNIYFKLDNVQIMNCSKVRGAFSRLTTIEDKNSRILVASSGNHALSVAYACKILGFNDLTVVIPENTHEQKVQMIRDFGANILLYGDNYDMAHTKAIQMQNEYIFIDPCSDELAIAGQASIASEILDSLDKIDNIFIPLGGGGILTGIARYIKFIAPDIKIIGVSPQASPAMKKAMENNIFYETFESSNSLCESLIGGIGRIPYELSKQIIDEIILVSEINIYKATKYMIEVEKLLNEPSSAITIAGYFENKEKYKGNSVLVLTGGNIDNKLLNEILKLQTD